MFGLMLCIRLCIIRGVLLDAAQSCVLSGCSLRRNPADVGGRLMTFTYVAFLSGLVTWNTSGLAEGIFDRLGVSWGLWLVGRGPMRCELELGRTARVVLLLEAL